MDSDAQRTRAHAQMGFSQLVMPWSMHIWVRMLWIQMPLQIAQGTGWSSRKNGQKSLWIQMPNGHELKLKWGSSN